jgi:hypothetical protein
MKRICSIALVSVLVAGTVFAAGEIIANFTLLVKKGSLDITRTVAQTLTLTAANPNVAGMTQSINTNTVGTALTLGDVSTNGVCWFRNLDAANYVEIGVRDVNTNFLPLVRLNASEAWPFRMAKGIVPYARANATNNVSVVLEKLIFDD